MWSAQRTAVADARYETGVSRLALLCFKFPPGCVAWRRTRQVSTTRERGAAAGPLYLYAGSACPLAQSVAPSPEEGR